MHLYFRVSACINPNTMYFLSLLIAFTCWRNRVDCCDWLLPSHTHSSSSGATTSTFECFVPLNISFPLITILDAANPIPYFKFLHVISYVTFPSVLWSPLWSYWHRFPRTYFLAYYAWPRTYPPRSWERNPWRQHVHRATRRSQAIDMAWRHIDFTKTCRRSQAIDMAWRHVDFTKKRT